MRITVVSIHSLIESQEVILHLQNFYNELNTQRNLLLEEQLNKSIDDNDRNNDNMGIYIEALEDKLDGLSQEEKAEIDRIKERKKEKKIKHAPTAAPAEQAQSPPRRSTRWRVDSFWML